MNIEQKTTEVNTPIENEITEIKALRQYIDIAIQRVKHLVSCRETSLTTTKLQEAVMWLGMDLKRIGEANQGFVKNPYPNSKDPSNTVIEPTADALKL